MSTLATSEFRHIAEVAKDLWGLNITEKKRGLVSTRLSKFLRKSPFDSVSQYLDHLKNEADEADMLVFFDLLSTNVTSFFRENQHFDYLEREFYTPLARGNLTLPGRRIRIWSAACSTGAEPFSMAMQALDLLPDLSSWDFQILATDLSNSALATARSAVYPEKMLEKLDSDLVQRHFLRGKGSQQDKVKVKDAVRKFVTLKQVNLMDSWSFRGPFDIIFCRNVMIYFDHDTRERLVNRFLKLLRPGGVFVIGSAETLAGMNTPFQTVQPSVYVK